MKNTNIERLKIIASVAVIASFLLFASGCSTMNKALQWAAAVNDTALESAEDLQCQSASIRAIRERYNTPEKIRAYNLLCGKTLAERE